MWRNADLSVAMAVLPDGRISVPLAGNIVAAGKSTAIGCISGLLQPTSSGVAVQQSLLPKSMPELPNVRFAWSYLPCDELAGDFLNILQLDEDHIAAEPLQLQVPFDDQGPVDGERVVQIVGNTASK